jgi:formylglycine-generating enzyme required for sulfatase activity
MRVLSSAQECEPILSCIQENGNMRMPFGLTLICSFLAALPAFASCPQGDILRDCIVDPSDLVVLASQWQAGKDRPDGMLLVKGGAFRPDNGQAWVQMPDYLIGRYEVTNAEYAYFLNKSQSYSSFFYDNRMSILRTGELGHYSFTVVPGREDYPVTYIGYYDAEAYAAWTAQETGRTYRLPTKYEWQKAAAWDPMQARFWIYGFQSDSIDCSWANYLGCIGDTSPVGFHNGINPGTHNAVSYYGCYDMTGNVWEWTSEESQGKRMILGGSAYYGSDECRTNNPYPLDPTFRSNNVGIRLVLDVDCPSADLTGDCQVDLADFAVLAANWLDDGSILDMEWVLINDPGVSGHEGFRGMMGKYLVTNHQYCEFLNRAKATGDIAYSGGIVKGAFGTNTGEDYVNAVYYNTTGTGLTTGGYVNAGASRIHYSGTTFTVDSGFQDHPVTYVSWYGAMAFASYYGYRLPTEWEYQAAADFDGTYLYGYGPTTDSSKVNCNETKNPDGTTVVGTFGFYGYGLADITGNVDEYTASEDGWKRVLRGGGFTAAVNFCKITSGLSFDPAGVHYSRGFRVVQDLPPADLTEIPWGIFQMGNLKAADEGGDDELPFINPRMDLFAIGKTEITNEQYCAFLNSALQQGLITFDATSGKIYQAATGTSTLYGSTAYNAIEYQDNLFIIQPKGGRDMSKDPVVCVTWYGSAAYCNWRSQQEGRETCYNLSTWECDFSKKGYRLPTEAEWEYAARGGLSAYRFPWGDTITHSQANYQSNAAFSYDLSPTRGYHPLWDDGNEPLSSPVGSFAANGFGLYDMAGNAQEWCNDWYSATYYESSPASNPTGPSTGSGRCLRGGSWYLVAGSSRVSARSSSIPHYWTNSIGFRVALNFR